MPSAPSIDALVRAAADARVEGEAAAVAAAEVERVRPLLLGAWRLPALVRGGDLLGLDQSPAAAYRYQALLLALVEQVLGEAQHEHQQREEDHQAEAEVRDDLVVGLAVEALAALAGKRDLGQVQAVRPR